MGVAVGCTVDGKSPSEVEVPELFFSFDLGFGFSFRSVVQFHRPRSPNAVTKSKRLSVSLFVFLPHYRICWSGLRLVLFHSGIEMKLVAMEVEVITLLFIAFSHFACCYGFNLEQQDRKALETDEALVLLSFKRALSLQVDALPDWDEANRQSFCSWTGVRCSSNNTVTGIHLGSKNFSGSLSPLLGDLRSLQQLNLSDNSLSGNIPGELFSLDGSLTALNLSFNTLTGPIPSTIYASRNLESIDLSRNSLTGGVPVDLGLLGRLRVLRLEGNNITGSVPASLGNCSQLVELSLIENQLDGEIPEELGKLRQLRYLRLYRNKLTGNVPGSLSNCSGIEELLVSENFLVGRIPESYGLLSKVKLLYLWGNRLTGSIPSSLSNCTELVQLLLDGNSLTGPLPPELGNRLTKLQILSIHSNILSGVIPESVANFSSLHSLWSHENRFSGSIPRSLGAMRGLSKVALEKNQLGGWIPEEIGNASRLQVLRLQENQLEGEIPATLGFLQDLQGLSLQSNRLEGRIPPELGRCSSLNYLKLQDNRLVGTIPSNLSQLSQLRNLDVSRNQLTGVIPASLSSCFRLENVDLSYNSLGGSIPPQVLKLPALLSGFNLSHNRLTGEIPRDFASMVLVQAIDLSANQLTGFIPESLGACTGLAKLDLSSNLLTGEIPPALGDLSGLSGALNLSRNNITGSIPEKLSKLKALSQLDLSHNQLSGFVPALDLPDLTVLDISSNNLEGPIPGPLASFSSSSFTGNSKLCGPSIHKKCRHRHGFFTWWKVLVVTVTGTLVLLLLLLVIAAAYVLKIHRQSIVEAPTEDIPHGLTKFTTSDLSIATDNFSSSNVVGVGALSSVYKAQLPGGRCIAVKKMASARTSRKLFLRELHTLGTLRHRNLGRVIGYCSTPELMAIILEFMPNGSLDKQLHDHQSRLEAFSTWEVRYKIALGTAQGLEYLHHQCSSPVLHCDLKPSNILLDSELQSRISDFGISKVRVQNTRTTTSSFKGTIGYVAPEYSYSSIPSTKGDVFSYGVVLLELVTGKRPTGNFGDGTSLVQWARSHFPGEIASLLDETIVFDRQEEHLQILQVFAVALACTREDPQQRPTMQDVLAFLTRRKAEHEEHCIETLAHASSPYDAIDTREKPSTLILGVMPKKINVAPENDT
ncbi:hypothetical protein SELMODRAFT_431458 [Selaginella moellendorffii]|uniref:non-specific serine/threonine protein kinase n=1 Tax=Selaginella moellendorffii TaxID=88036 RepID=D8TCQ3_SELML|nr:hypothetical protein SELMODRAFT_431458 [Selaginella moellendorffii]